MKNFFIITKIEIREIIKSKIFLSLIFFLSAVSACLKSTELSLFCCLILIYVNISDKNSSDANKGTFIYFINSGLKFSNHYYARIITTTVMCIPPLVTNPGILSSCPLEPVVLLFIVFAGLSWGCSLFFFKKSLLSYVFAFTTAALLFWTMKHFMEHKYLLDAVYIFLFALICFVNKKIFNSKMFRILIN